VLCSVHDVCTCVYVYVHAKVLFKCEWYHEICEHLCVINVCGESDQEHTSICIYSSYTRNLCHKITEKTYLCCPQLALAFGDSQ
jgi:hypothetical protein